MLTMCLLITIFCILWQIGENSGDPILFAEECSTPDGAVALCIPLFYCSKLRETIENGNSPPDFIEQFICGNNPSGPLVCCGGSFNITLTTRSPIYEMSKDTCLTPNQEEGYCISLYSCPRLLTAALANLNEVSRQFVEKSRCGGTQADPLVCCGTLSNFTEKNISLPSKPAKNEKEKSRLLPTRKHCGYQHSDDYIGNQNDITTKLSEFPWLAGLIYQGGGSNSDRQPLCGGSLISRKYILTAAHCVSDEIGAPTAIHLGEYDTTAEEDCVQEGQFSEECSEPVQVYGVQKIIPHPGYNERTKDNDIALIRIKSSAQYNDFVRPICLPFPPSQMAEVGDTLTATGWGKTNPTGTESRIKKRIPSILITKGECASYHDSEQYKIDDHRLCTTPLKTTEIFACTGDSGGPLQFSTRKSQWHLEGISSFGKSCGSEIPNVYTRVASYLDWILDNIEK